jgi:hypothetical protein
MTNCSPRIYPELKTSAGEILISHNHIALLQGLYASPRRRTHTIGEWISASTPYVKRYRRSSSPGCLLFAARRLNPRWVTKVRRGRRIEVSLTKRGAAIVEARVSVWVHGWGTHTGFRRIKRLNQGKRRLQKPPKSRHSRRPAAEKAAVAAAPTVSLSAPQLSAPSLPVASVIAAEAIREAVAYANAYGLPLLTHQSASTDLTIVAVATQLDGRFVLKGLEEVEHRGRRSWHARWTQIQLERGYLPAGYRRSFANYDEADVLCYLRELTSTNRDKSAYCHAYAGHDFLSAAKLHEWLAEEIDFADSDMHPSDIPVVTRAFSQSRARLLAFIGTPGVLSWAHPDTGKTIGRIVNPNMSSRESFEIVASNPVALSCLQLALDAAGTGIRIETRYFPDSSADVQNDVRAKRRQRS